MNGFQKKPQTQFSPIETAGVWPQVLRLALVALAYWVAVRLGLLIVAQPEGVASIWPASGLALAVLLLNPKRLWGQLLVVLFVTNVVGNLNSGSTLLVSLGFGLANMLEALLCAWTLTRFYRSKISFGNTLEIFLLFGIAIFVNGLTALLGAAVAWLAFAAPFLNTWLVWWSSDGLGMILVTPLIVTWAVSQSMFQTAFPRRIVEAGLLTLGFAVFAWFLFGKFTVAEAPFLRNYMLFPFLIWLAFRYSPRGMASALTLLAGIAIWNTLLGYGIFGFANQTVTEHLISVQVFLSVIVFSGLLLSAMVSERKQAQEALQKSEQDYRLLVENMNAGVFQSSLDGSFLLMNQALVEMAGYESTPELMSKPATCLYADPADRERLKDMLRLDGEVRNLELLWIKKNGTQFWISMNATFQYDRNGKIENILGIVTDISERKQDEARVIIINKAVESASDAIGVSDARGHHIYQNKALSGLFGYETAEEMESAGGGAAVVYDPQVAREMFARIMSGNSWAGELDLVTKSGHVFPAYERADAIKDLEGNIIGLIGIITDITERKKAEDDLRKLEQEYRLLAENSPDLISRFGTDLRHLYVNPVAAQSGKLSPAEYIGLTIAESGVPEPDATQWKERIRNVIESGKMVEVVDTFPTPGGLRHYHTRFIPEFRPDGSIASVLSVAHDITTIVQAEETLKEYNTRLETEVEARARELLETQEKLVQQERLATLGQVAGSVGHELRNPLGVISNAVYYLKMIQPDAGGPVREYLDMIEKETRNSSKIITDLLDFARVKSLAQEPVSVADVVRQTLARYPVSVSVQVELAIPADLPPVFADPQHVLQVLGNLVLNACQAMPEGGRLVIRAESSEVDGKSSVGISVMDNGLGIPPGNMSKLFEPLFTTRTSGIGLGLAVSQKLAEANGGRIEVQSEVGQGSTFTLYLPVDS
jgi:PAS domain S-box-containing protein